jgi:methionyl-tRNA formyltransferase
VDTNIAKHVSYVHLHCLQDGVATTGVSVAFTVLKCDAGPIFLQEKAAVPEDEQAPELLERLFKQGAQLLVSNIERVWSGEAAQVAQQQDEAQATHAAKVGLAMAAALNYADHRCHLHDALHFSRALQQL